MAEKEKKTKTTAKAAESSAAPKAKKTAAKKTAAKKTAKAEPAPAKAAAKTKKAEAPTKPKTEKPAKAAKNTEKKDGGNSSKSALAALVKTRKFKIIAISSVAVIFVLCLTLGIVFGVSGKSPSGDGSLDGSAITDTTFAGGNGVAVTTVTGTHRNKTQVGYSAEIVDTVDRVRPVAEVKNEGLSTKGYPKYGSTLNLTTAEKTTVIQENRKLTANGTWVDSSARTSGTYDKMDKDGYLYKKDGTKPAAGVPERLYKHSGSVGLYGGNVSDDEPAVIKKLTLRPRSYSSYYSVTGLYAPAGEVIKIEMTDADMNATGGITIHIGQALYNGQANNIWEQRNFNRMPVILNTMSVTKETATYDEATGLWTGYVGSFLGGPIYVRDESVTFSLTISGGVNYAHFILGVTTEDEFNLYSQSTAPYFDLEVWDRGVLHSGPKRAAKNFSYNDLYKAAVLWEKIALVTTSVSNQGIVFLYDPFVAAGAAVAFPGRRSVNCPEGWMSGSLNYNSIVTSGSWGNLHEYHHNFQDYGVGYTGEVTNNGLNLVSYSLFTKISSSRQISGYGGAGLSGWNQYTSATWALQRVNNNQITSTNGLAVYATLLHNYGQDAFIQTRGAWGNNYYDKWANFTRQDMTYYAGLVSSYGGGYTPSNAVKNANYPLFVPVSSVYQTGRTYTYGNEKREITTMQPYVIPYGKSFKVDLRQYANLKNGDGSDSGQYDKGSIVIAKDFKFSIKNVKTDGINGTFVETDEKGVYTFTPNSQLNSGKIYVTLEITTQNGAKEWNGHKLDDVDLILEFQQSHETNKSVLERTTYFYTADTAYTDARTAYENGFAGFESRRDVDHSNPTQNANTDIWYCTESSLSKFPKADPELHVVTPNSIDELRGKLYFPEAGKYRIYLRGRRNCALYYSVDGGKTYLLGTYIDNDTRDSSAFVEGKHFDLELQAESWVYIKEVLINAQLSAGMAGYIGVGIAQWTTPMFTAEVKYYTEISGVRKDLTQETVDGAIRYYFTNNNQKQYVDNASVKAETIYKNGSGQTVSAEEASDTSLKPPALSSAAYATAYRQSYEFNKEFTSDYFYVRTYSYSYTDNVLASQTQTLVKEQCNYSAPPTSWGWGNFPIANLVDGKTNTYIHTSWKVTESSPLKLTLDLGEEKTVNRIKFYCRNNNGQLETPKAFTLEGSLDGTEWFDVATFTDAPRNGNQVTADFELTKLRYYRLVISSTHQGAYYVVIGEIELWNINEINGATVYSPDDAGFTYRGSWQSVQTNATFGHVYLGTTGSEITYTFKSTGDTGRFGILTSNKYGQNFEVYVDGNKVDTEKLKDDANETALRYLTPKLPEGSHTVTVKCTGEANFDSFVVFP